MSCMKLYTFTLADMYSDEIFVYWHYRVDFQMFGHKFYYEFCD